MNFAQLTEIYNGSDGEATRRLYQRLCGIGPAGMIGMNLFRASKTSARAKLYRGGNGRGSYKSQAYDTKQWSIGQLCDALRTNPGVNLEWGWGTDDSMDNTDPHRHVLYIDLPTGQVSFHTPAPFQGPQYQKPWDGVKQMGPTRICRWVATLFDEPDTSDIPEATKAQFETAQQRRLLPRGARHEG